MNNSQDNIILIVLGLMLITVPIVKAGLEKIGMPALVGFIGLGLLTRLINHYFSFVTANLQHSIAFLAEIGIYYSFNINGR